MGETSARGVDADGEPRSGTVTVMVIDDDAQAAQRLVGLAHQVGYVFGAEPRRGAVQMTRGGSAGATAGPSCAETDAHRIRDGWSANPGGRHTLKWNSRSTLFEVEPATRVNSQSSVLMFDSLSNPSHRPVILFPVGSTNSWMAPRYTAPL
jgi:hypothetical protein